MKLYEENLKIQWDEYSILKSQKEEGRKEGRIEGKLEGRKEGKLEERLTIAREFKKNGASLSLIIKCTGLTKEEIETL